MCKLRLTLIAAVQSIVCFAAWRNRAANFACLMDPSVHNFTARLMHFLSEGQCQHVLPIPVDR